MFSSSLPFPHRPQRMLSARVLIAQETVVAEEQAAIHNHTAGEEIAEPALLPYLGANSASEGLLPQTRQGCRATYLT